MAALSLPRAALAWRWRLRHLAGRRGAGALLLTLALTAALAAAAWYRHAGQQLEGARAAQQALPPPATPRAGVEERRQMLQQFTAQLPPADELPVIVQSLMDLAEQQGLRLQRGSYRLQPEAAARFARYRMNLPLQGDPARVQRYVQAALLAWPTLAIESIQFRREQADGRLLEARVQWVLFVRADGGAAAPVAAASEAGS